jgi:hypothetical protein
MAHETTDIAREVHDFRLDACRGIALWFVFIDHVPNNIAAWLTLRNYGFSDASEVFVFVSGYTCMLAYGARLRQGGWPSAIGHALRRSCEIYLAFLILFASYVCLIWLVGARFLDDTNTAVFFQSPGSAMLHALTLQYTPVNTDILPTFVLLHLVFPAILWGLTTNAPATLLGSAGLYLAVQLWDLNLPSWPRKEWYFNPLAWQALFVLGAWCAGDPAARLRRIAMSRATLLLAVAYLMFSLAVTLRWHIAPLVEMLPASLVPLVYPIEKSSLDPLRILHFLSLAVVAARPLSRLDSRAPARWTVPLVRCGRHSLIVFCFSVLLSFAGHVLLQGFDDAAVMQLAISAAGIALMVAVAATLDRIGRTAAWRPRSF